MINKEAQQTHKLAKPAGDANGASLPGGFNSGVIKLKEASFEFVEMLKVVSGEADLYIVKSKADGLDYILKYYRHNIEPKQAIVEMLSTIKSERVVRLFDYGTTCEGRFYELQEFAAHGSLESYIKNNPELIDSGFIREFAREMNQALIEIHSTNIIHRDIKPSNILVKSIAPLAIALTDFGISSVSSSLVHQTNLDRTVTYAAPEALSGVVSQSSDYWSFGIIILEMLLSKHPFDGMDAKTVTYYITTKDVPGLEAAASEFYPLVKGLLNRDDKKRWGRKQVGDWLDNIIKSDFYEPFSFYGRKCFDLKEFTRDLIVNWERAALEIISIKQWFLKNTGDRGLVPLVKDLCRPKDSNDESLFELIYILNPDIQMIFKKKNITPVFMADLSFKIYNGEASEEEIAFFNALIDCKIFEKYYDLSGKNDEFKAACLAGAGQCRPIEEPEARAAEFLKYIAPERLSQKDGFYKSIAAKLNKIKNDEHIKVYIYVVGIGLLLMISFIFILFYD
jgi:serine/threonine protein kinase